MSAIPVEVIVEILCRLPVKSLLRFRCLSKQFRSIIDEPDFINRHLQYHSSDQSLIVLNKSCSDSAFTSYLFSVNLDSAGNASKLEHPFENWSLDYDLVGSCNGLLALSHRHSFSVGLWNISTKKRQILPKFWTDFDVPNFCFSHYHFVYSCFYLFDGFGYDVVTDDYKWVRVIHFDTKNYTEVTVYSLKTNSWRRIEDAPPYLEYYSVFSVGNLVGGALNWEVLAVDFRAGQGDNLRRVLSFDLKDEKFRDVSLPNEVVEDDLYFRISVLGGCLCLISYSHVEVLKVLDIWIMKEYGVKESWTKMYSYTEEMGLVRFNVCGATRALTYSKHGDKVLIYQDGGEVFCYDLEKKTVEPVEINGWPKFIFLATSHVDSLVSPNVNIWLGGFGEKKGRMIIKCLASR